MDKELDIVAIGEVLWDIFLPSRPHPTFLPKIGGDRGGTGEMHLGGAPFNFTAHCHHLGARSGIVSRVGQDEPGDEILARAQEPGVDASLIQRDAGHPTGQVHVTPHADGQPAFDIRTGVAYDHLAADPAAMEHVRTADVVCFGTLAQRHPVARQSISALLDAATQALLVRDLNLHPPHYSVDIVHGSLLRCHLLKLNDDELRTVQTMLGQDDLQNDLDEDTFPLHLLESYGLKLVCVTLEQ